VRDALAAATAALGDRGPFRHLAERLHGLLAELDDVTTELRDVTDAIDDDPARLEEVRQRRQLLRDLGRKYGNDLAEVIAYRDEAARRLGELQRFDQRAGELDVARAAAIAAADAAAAAVRAARVEAAPRLAAAVTERLRQLALPHADLAVDVGEQGAGDRVVFLFSANPGSPLLPLTKVASGGELARAMLALRLVLTGSGPEQATFVFDEVDAGIGGNAASAVGHALAEVGRRHQVLVVTHLAQVAAQASTHLVVTKSVDGTVTTATAQAVDGDARVDEVARMLSGAAGGDAGRQHAEELLRTSPSSARRRAR
jgi:DNA repair protein RecN (Recombination protein N)